HDGGVEIAGLSRDGVLSLRLTGNCHGCPSSQATITSVIERAVAETAPEVCDISVETEPALLQIGSRPPGPCPVPDASGGLGAGCAREGETMMKRLLIGVAVAGIAVLVVQSMPDIRRYRKIRGM